MDFIIFGPARSGTTALCNILLATREIFCGIEFFSPDEDHSKLKMPKAFYEKEERFATNPVRLNNNHRRTLQELRSREQDSLLLYGNKLPLYYRRLGGIFRELGHDKSIMTFRNFHKVAESYSMIDQSNQPLWPKGRNAFFAVGDAMLLIKALAKYGDSDILIVPQQPLAKNWRRVMNFVGNHLLPGIELTFDQKKILEIEERNDSRQFLTRPELTRGQLIGLEMLEKTGISEILDRTEPYHIREVLPEIAQAAKILPNDHIGYLVDLVEAHGKDRERAYLAQWLNVIANKAEL
jgi:hypothetical protein